MRGAYVVKANLLAGFDIDPVVIRKTPTRKSDEMRPFDVDNRSSRSRSSGEVSMSFHSMMDYDHPPG
jgi:hypothetical protein